MKTHIPALIIAFSILASTALHANENPIRKIQIETLESIRLPDVKIEDANLSDIIENLKKLSAADPEKKGFNFAIATIGTTKSTDFNHLSLNLHKPTLGAALAALLEQVDFVMIYEEKSSTIKLMQQ